MREMGELTGADIEPPQQTLLLNRCVSQAGVIGGGVPGGEFVVHPLLSYSCTHVYVSWRI